MRITIEKPNQQEQELKFPLLMKSKSTGAVILITGKSDGSFIGTVLQKGKSIYDVGHTSGTWVAGWLDTFEGKLTMEND